MKLSLPAKTILLPSPVLIIGTYGADGKPNIMNAAWGGIASSKPPYVNVSIREATLTYHNIIQTEAFTVNIPSEQFVKEADFVGLVSGREYNKFDAARLTPVKSKLVNAPIVNEFPYALECRLAKKIGLDMHTMFVGEIVGMIADSDVLNNNQIPDIEKVRPMLWGSFGSNGYYNVGQKLGDSFSIGNEIITELNNKF